MEVKVARIPDSLVDEQDNALRVNHARPRHTTGLPLERGMEPRDGRAVLDVLEPLLSRSAPR
jgi:hypothetical protein